MFSRCTKCRFFNIFNAVILFCVINFFIYRFFSVPKTNVAGKYIDASDSPNAVRQATQLGDVNNLLTLPHEAVAGGSSHQGSNSLDPSLALNTSTKAILSPEKSPQVDSNKVASDGNEVPSKSYEVPADSKNVPAVPVDSKNAPTNSSKTVEISPTTEQQQQKVLDGVSKSSANLEPCPVVPPKLNGPLATYSNPVSFEKIAKDNPGLQPGGRYKPPECVARHRVAIVIPYRNREEHLQILLNNLHPMLMRQQLDYGVFVIDQALPTRFNRAMLMNIGWVEAMKRYGYQCAVFHDVDLIPENDRNIYSCPEQPRHLSAAIDKFRYRLPYAGIYGGVSAVSKAQFEKINGFSNMFFGWGGEDDDISTRIRSKGYKITRYPMDIARYRMIKHTNDKGNEQNPQRHALLKTTTRRMSTDGLNSLKYKVQKVEEMPTHLRIEVYINQDDIMKS